ncbi:ABC transporter substrate-binding protein [Fusobacterium necrophorum]|uniref:ABC transporter substrate-binding protein n=2 Tax=Fusobacterium necrophorum TaxID=859 RepID=A0AB73BWV8_9FUSO|nr:ABC transporter substrate-binding protein [Fusobacterium necrophorum]AYZ74568.1 ABC transporter substrate-binding protein [Fusobacterium necrophorum]AZW09548.1 ABC transporter substrate-binding protein [Fusobacterium necrophorum subsp. necrophorum]KDE63704.1 ABC transporter substrate-binding protein [Fusobacterium necrophorum BL]KDE68188.1 ABC transporter substrate-binding protein [Fusobacterium necrophorum DJ-1]KDE72302.1 ABC transporter substrate-binding protein [Fusobacterium necrophorum
MIKKIFLFIILTVFSVSLIGCSEKNSKMENRETNENQVVIENFGVTTTYDKAPEKLLPLSYDAAQTLVALGLEDKIVGVATAEGSYKDCLPEYQDKLSKLDIIVEGTPNFETLLSKNPDFVYATVYTFGKRGVAPIEDFQREHINFYCINGTFSEKPSINDIYKDIEDLGKIFRKESEARKLIDSLKEREKLLKNKTNPILLKVMAYDGGEKTATTAGQGIENEIISLAGGNNIFSDLNNAFEEVSWEEVAKRNPDIILIHSYDQGETSGTVEEKINRLKNDSALKNVTAIKEDNFVVVKLVEVFPGLQIFDAAERLNEKIVELTK